MTQKRFLSTSLITLMLSILMVSCSTTRYVPQGDYLLSKNRISISKLGKQDKNNQLKSPTSESGNLANYIIQRPNAKIFGMNLRLGVYSASDTSKHDWWHRFFINKVGQPPVILDTTLLAKSASQMSIYMASKGYLRASVSTSVKTRKRKAVVTYSVNPGAPYTISSIDYAMADKFMAEILLPDTINSLLKVGNIFDRSVLEAERTRITTMLNDMGFWGFGNNYISYTADSSLMEHKVALTLNLRQRVLSTDNRGQQTLGNHPIYRIQNITINSDYDPTWSAETNNNALLHDTLNYNGIDLLYKSKIYIRPKILADAVRLAPNQLYDARTVKRTYNNIRSLSYNPNILFSTTKADTLDEPIYVTLASGQGANVSTQEKGLSCLIQCAPIMRQSLSPEIEVTTTSDYYSLALKIGYQNRNIFGGAELFNVSFRGAYEFMKNSKQKNSYEFGISTSIDVPRFWLPISKDAMAKFTSATTRMSLSYNIQNRPNYNRSLISATYGYGWTMNNGARFTINPADINVIDVPWVNQDFLNSIQNEYLRNTYRSQLIGGLSASYFYNTSSNPRANGFTLRVNADVNGNLYSLVAPIFHSKVIDGNERYYNLFGLRFQQYARAIAEVSQRVNLSDISQLAWRFVAGGAYAYGNSTSVPFERQFFVGGNNSMRGWQPRTLGPGGYQIPRDTVMAYPNQLGNIRLEANLEYRVNVAGGLNLALFVDAGNVWLNSKGQADNGSRFKFSTFYKQIALDAGLGLRYDFSFAVIRLDWGWKMHNPNLPQGERWFSQLKIKDTALHFAIGLPF